MLFNVILEKIFIYINIDIIRQLNKSWKIFADKHEYKFKNINIDLLKTDIEKLKYYNPSTINITCSKIYDEKQFQSKITNEILKNESNILKTITTRLNFIRKYPFLKRINLKLNLIYLNRDKFKIAGISYLKYESEQLIDNPLSVYCIKFLLNCKVDIFFLYIDNCKYYPHWSFINHYEDILIDFLIDLKHNYEKLCYNGSSKISFTFEKNTKSLCIISGNLYNIKKRLKSIENYQLKN